MEDAPELRVETSSDVPADHKPQSSPSNAIAASPSPSNSPTTKSEDPTQTQETYSQDLFRAFPKVCQKAKSGVQLCQAVSAFVTERASLESSYAQSLLKLAQSAKAEDWSEQLTECWAIFQEATEHLAQERWAFASTLQTTIVPGAKAFATQQEVQVQRLISEGTKVRWAEQQMISSMDKAREKYERKCQEAIEITTAVRKSENPNIADFLSSSSSSALDLTDEISSSKELTDKLAAGAGQLLTKMWDSTSAFGRNPLERQRSKLYSGLEEVIAAEKHYVQSVEYTNAQQPIFERESKENLHAFQLTEEQRLEYLRDVLVRMQKAFVGMFSRSQQFVERMKESANSVNELADIEKGFQSLGSQEEIDVDKADLATNPFYLRITHIQTMSDNGQRMIGVINSVVSEFIASENRFSQSLRKLLRTHENGGPITPSDLFGTSPFSANTNFLADEGATMVNGWMTARDQVKLLLEVHHEFRSLLAEPVSLSLSTMKSECEDVRVSTQENFSKVHLSLCNESAAYRKFQHKLETKSRDFAVTFSRLPGATPVTTTSHGIEVAQALKLLSANLHSFNEKERRSEAKLRQLAEEIRLLQKRVAESSSALRQTYQIYVQEVEVFISTCMKNEKYRLQVGKNSLQSLAKALEHMLQGGTSVGNKALTEFEKIDPRSDMSEFIRINRQPYERSKRIVPVYHGNDSLKEVMRDYLASLKASTSMPPESADKTLRRFSSSTFPLVSLPSGEVPASREPSPRASTVSSQNTQTTPSSENGAGAEDGANTNEEESVRSSVEKDDDFVEALSLGVSDFQKKFKLDSPEQVVESFSCALYLTNFPFHGRLYLTRNRMCFSGWRDTIFVASFFEIASMEKKNTALIVPNAIEFTVKGEKVFFTSFVFRDECYQSIQQLRSIKTETEALLSDPSKQPDIQPTIKEGTATDGALKRRRSSNDVAAVAPSPELAPVNTADESSSYSTDDNRAPTALNSDDSAGEAAPMIPDKDELLSEYDLVLNEEVAFSVKTAFSTLWVESDAFSRSVIEAAGSTNISIPPWEKKEIQYTAVNKPDSFEGSRLVSYIHNKKYIVGPSVIPTAQNQRYSYTPRSRLVVSTTTCVSDVPYCDYFRVEQRWVFSATKKRGSCLAQVGLRVQWLKSTWLKKQIEGTTVSETKDAIKTWLIAATDATKQTPSVGTGAVSCVATNASSTEQTLANEQEDKLSKDLPRQMIPANSAHLASSIGTNQLTQLQPTIRAAIIICALMFIYTMYRVITTMDTMQELTREALIQQREQQELLRDLLLKLGSTKE